MDVCSDSSFSHSIYDCETLAITTAGRCDMIVYVNGRFMEYALAGVTRYAFSVIKEIDAWLEQNSHLQIILLVSSKNR